MIEKRLTWISKIFDGFGDDVSEKVVTRLREDRRDAPRGSNGRAGR